MIIQAIASSLYAIHFARSLKLDAPFYYKLFDSIAKPVAIQFKLTFLK